MDIKKKKRLCMAAVLLVSFTHVVFSMPRTGEVDTIDEIKEQALAGVEMLSNSELKQRIEDNPKLVLLDVRTEQEYTAGHIKGAAWVQRGIVEFVLVRTLRDADQEIVVYCKKGYRSGLVVKALREMGYNNVYSHVGFDQWVSEGNSYQNYHGESRLIRPVEKTAAGFKPDYFQPKNNAGR
ncbi:MAG: rhodanese-like domain-containing protein [Porticoccaceae bacterium]